MRARIGGLVGLTAVLAATAVGQPTAAQKPTWVYAHDLKVRKLGVSDFGPDTPKVGVEFFKDDAGGALVGISQAGSLAVVPGGNVGADKKATWLYGHELRARRGDEEKFTQSTAKYSLEAFKDAASGRVLYVTEKAQIALADVSGAVRTDGEPTWHHGLILKVRKPNEKDFTNAKAFGVEAFKDGNTGGLIYISETGSIAAAPAPPQAPDAEKVKKPTSLYGLELRVRKADEKDFVPGKTPTIAVEVFRDENTGGLIYITENGSIATAPAAGDLKGGGKGVLWKHAFTLKARPGGVNEFDKANRFGVEVFQDNNAGHLIYVSDVGSISVLKK